MTTNKRILKLSTATAIYSAAIVAGVLYFAPLTHAIHGAVNTNESNVEIKINNETERRSDSQNSIKIQEKADEQKASDDHLRQPESLENKARRGSEKQKLSATNLEICNSRKDSIDRRVARISERTEKQLALFNGISERAQTFYTSRGDVLENYDTLTADVTAKKDAATVAVATLIAQKDVFDCEADDPKGTIATYKSILNDAIAALREYRTSIKDLIVGIKSVNSNEELE